MTIQALIFLSRLRFVQMSEENTVYFCSGQKTFHTIVEADSPRRSWKCKRSLNELTSMIEYLVDEKLLTHPQPEYLHLTYRGYHYIQTLVTLFLAFLLRSIVVPILVSVATTLVTLWITSG